MRKTFLTPFSEKLISILNRDFKKNNLKLVQFSGHDININAILLAMYNKEDECLL